MFGSGRTAGITMMISGTLLACFCTSLSLVTSIVFPHRLVSWSIGLFITFLLSFPLIGFGTFLFQRGRRELAELAQIKKQKTILKMIKPKGQVAINDVVLVLKTNQDEVQDLIYDLVGQDLFHGYINWEEGVLYCQRAKTLRSAAKCPNCGSEQRFNGKGIVQCLHCHTQIFL